MLFTEDTPQYIQTALDRYSEREAGIKLMDAAAYFDTTVLSQMAELVELLPLDNDFRYEQIYHLLKPIANLNSELMLQALLKHDRTFYNIAAHHEVAEIKELKKGNKSFFLTFTLFCSAICLVGTDNWHHILDKTQNRETITDYRNFYQTLIEISHYLNRPEFSFNKPAQNLDEFFHRFLTLFNPENNIVISLLNETEGFTGVESKGECPMRYHTEVLYKGMFEQFRSLEFQTRIKEEIADLYTRHRDYSREL